MQLDSFVQYCGISNVVTMEISHSLIGPLKYILRKNMMHVITEQMYMLRCYFDCSPCSSFPLVPERMLKALTFISAFSRAVALFIVWQDTCEVMPSRTVYGYMVEVLAVYLHMVTNSPW